MSRTGAGASAASCSRARSVLPPPSSVGRPGAWTVRTLPAEQCSLRSGRHSRAPPRFCRCLANEEVLGGLSRVRLEVVDRLAAIQDQVTELFSRIAPHSSAVEQASAGGAASVGGGLALKATLTCIAVTGTAVVCVSGGVVGPSPIRPAKEVAKAPERQSPRPAPVQIAQARVTPPVEIKRPAPAPEPRRVGARRRAGVAIPRPPASAEFGPGTVGSSPAPAVPAAAPNDGPSAGQGAHRDQGRRRLARQAQAEQIYPSPVRQAREVGWAALDRRREPDRRKRGPGVLAGPAP